MFKNEKNVNYVEASGKIVGIGRDDYGRKRLVLFIRGYQQRRPIYASFAISKDVNIDFKVEDNVVIKGRIVAYLFENELWNGRTTYTQYLVADSVVPDETELKRVFDVDGGFAYKDPYIRVYLRGEVIKKTINEQAGWINFILRIPNETGKTNEVRLQFSKRMRVNDVEFEEGDEMVVFGTMSSKRKNINGQVRSFEDFIVDDMAKIEKQESKNVEEKTEEEVGINVEEITQ